MAAVKLDFDVEPVSPDRVERLRQLADWHAQWSAEQVAAGVDGPVPDGRPDPSDWNVHVPDLQAPPAAEDDFHAEARRIMGIPDPDSGA